MTNLSLAEEFEHIDREAAWFRSDQRYTPAAAQPIVLTCNEEPIGTAFGLENVYRAYEFVPYTSWHYEREDFR